MKYRWYREYPLGLAGSQGERWTLRHPEGEQCFQVRTRFGKSVDLGKIKAKHTFRSEVASVAAKREYYDRIGQFIPVRHCQVCHSPLSSSEEIMPIWSVTYRRCLDCAHTYADARPRDEIIRDYYENQSDAGKAYYLQQDEIELRIRELYLPKVRWLMDSYRRVYGESPRSLLDIGAGSGHFLHAARALGLEVAGLEIDELYRRFAKENFGIELVKDETQLQGKYDLITSFNVIEHVLDLSSFLQLHKRFSSERVFIAAETPNFESMTVWLQRIFPERLRGYFAPYEHVQLFTQSSLATAFFLHGFGVTDCWVFGQDTREFAFQLTEETGGDASEFINSWFNQIQAGFDQANFGDLILMGAAPLGVL
jgi:SAM-dependent methyltransferase